MGENILVCESDPQEAAWLQTALETGRSPFKEAEAVRLAHTLTDALAWVVKWPPDIVLLDLFLCPEQRDFVVAVEAMKQLAPEALWIALASDVRLHAADLSRISLCHLDGAIEKRNPANILLRKVKLVSPGKPWFQVSGHRPLPALPLEQAFGPDPKVLSAQERQTLCLVACGSSRKEIAKALNISQETVTTYLKRIRHKLGFSKPVQLYRYGRAYGLLPDTRQAGEGH